MHIESLPTRIVGPGSGSAGSSVFYDLRLWNPSKHTLGSRQLAERQTPGYLRV